MERKWKRSSCRRIRHTKILYSFDRANYVLSEQSSAGWTASARSVKNLYEQRRPFYHFNFRRELKARLHNFVSINVQYAPCHSVTWSSQTYGRRDARVDSKTKRREESANDVRQKYACRRLRSGPGGSPSPKQFRFNSRPLCATPPSSERHF